MKNTVMHIVHKGIEHEHVETECSHCSFRNECLDYSNPKFQKLIHKCTSSKGWRKIGNNVKYKK